MQRALRASFLALSIAVSSSAAAEWQDYKIEEYAVQVVIGEHVVDYDFETLTALSTAQGKTMRETKTVKGVPLQTLIKKAQTKDRDYSQIVILSDERTLIFEGEDLRFMDHLLLKLGDNHAAIMADSPESYDMMRSVLGKPRFKTPRKIFVYEIAE